MPAIRTYLDAGVLLVAFRGQAEDAAKALALLEDRIRPIFRRAPRVSLSPQRAENSPSARFQH